MPLGDVLIRFARLSTGRKWAAMKMAVRNPRLLMEQLWPPTTFKVSIASNTGDFAALRPAPFVLLAANHGTLIVNRHDFSGSEQFGFGVGYQLLNTSAFNPEEIRLAQFILSERKKTHGSGVVAIDCGANLGVHTVEWARQMADWGSVVAIEAQERVFYSLCGNININNCMNARAIWAAVGAESGKIRIPALDYNKPASFGSLELQKRARTENIGQKINYDDDACVTVDLIAIDDLNLERVDFLKIDVEGMEVDVLIGAKKTIEGQRPAMIIEIIKSDGRKIETFLKELGYTIHRFAENILALHASHSTIREVFEKAATGSEPRQLERR